MMLVNYHRKFILKIFLIRFICRLEQSDRIHDYNTKKFIECIKTSRNVCGSGNLIAIKVTALIRPNILKKFNILLKSIKNRSSLPSIFELINQERKIELFQQSNILSHGETTEIYNLLIRLNKIAQVK